LNINQKNEWRISMGFSLDAYKRAQKAVEEYNKTNNPLPKCPICGSSDVRRISSGEKIGSTLMLGIFSNKRKQQFECLNPNCKYKF